MFIDEHEKSFLEVATVETEAKIEIVFRKERGKDQENNEIVEIDDFISLKGVKAKGNKLSSKKIKEINRSYVEVIVLVLVLFDCENFSRRAQSSLGVPESDIFDL